MRPTDGGSPGIIAPLAPARWIAVPAVLALTLIVLDRATNLDLSITRAVYDGQAHAFTLRSTFLLDIVMYHWVKGVVVILVSLIGAGFLLSYVLPPWKPYRPALRFLLLAMALAPLSVALGKEFSARHCPWDIDEFGGLAAYTRIFDRPASDALAGRCFPAAHASAGFLLMAFYFVAFALRERRIARCALSVGIAAGLVLGFGRVLQGAHFMSHVLWAGVYCWTVMLILYQLLLAGRIVNDSAAAGLAGLGR